MNLKAIQSFIQQMHKLDVLDVWSLRLYVIHCDICDLNQGLAELQKWSCCSLFFWANTSKDKQEEGVCMISFTCAI